jgi:hypothetical protein
MTRLRKPDSTAAVPAKVHPKQGAKAPQERPSETTVPAAWPSDVSKLATAFDAYRRRAAEKQRG